jgi:hypothetical protein
MANNPQAEDLRISERILKIRTEILQLEEQENELTSEQQKILEKNEAILSKLIKYQEKVLKTQLGTTQLQLEYTDNLSKQKSELSSISSIYNSLGKVQRESLKTIETSLSSYKIQLLSDVDKKEVLDSTLAGVYELQSLQQRLAESNVEDGDVQQSIRDSYIAQESKLKEMISVKSGLGIISKDEALALMDALETQKESLTVAEKYGTISGHTKEFLSEQLEVYKTIEKTITGVLSTAQVLASTTGGRVGAALIGAGFAAEALGENIRKFGGFIDTAQISALGLGFVFEGAEETLKSLSSQFGGMENISFSTQLNTNLMATNMGISGEEAANIVGSFARLNGMSMETAMDMAATTKSMAKAAGVPVDQVMRDVANSTEAFALYGKEGGANIAQAGVYAAKLGVSMDTLTGMADNLLDFESSITSELELGAMLGKNINFNRARALAFEGQIGAAVKEQLNQLGGIEAFNKMDPIAKKKAAEALGVSVAELQKMAANMDKLNDDGTVQLTQFEQWYEALTAFATGPLGSVLKGLGGAVVAGAQLGGSFAQMGVDVKGIASKIPIIGKMFGQSVPTPSPTTEGSSITGKLSDNIGGGKVGKSGDFGKGVEKNLKGISKGLVAIANPKALLGLAAITASIIGIGFALKIAAPGIVAIGDAISSVVRAIGDMVSTVIGGLGDFFVKLSSIASPEMVLSVMGLAGSFAALSASLATFAIAGLAAIPAMTAVGLFAATGGASLLDVGTAKESDTPNETSMVMSELLTEIKGLRSDLNNGKIAVYVDGRKVTSSVSRVVDKVSTNSYGL